MHLKSLYLKHFRNHTEREITFSPQLNVIYGDNAQGKTNLLEAIYLIATGRSFRSQHLTELIQEGQSGFFLEAHLIRNGVAQTVKVSFDGQMRHLQIDGNTHASFQPLLGLLPCVLYTPYDIELISGSPSERRRFLNLHLAQSDPLYVHHLTRYWRAMKQRNCLLRTKDTASLECWEAEMAQSAAYLWQARAELIDELQAPLATQGLKLAQEVHEIQLHSTQPESYLKQLQKNRPREIELGLTLTGPHRDDFSLLISGKAARLFASEGQKKTAIAALRLAEWERLCRKALAPALMGIDDLGSHLDETRQAHLRGALSTLGQTFVTTTHSLPHGHPIAIAR